MFQQEDLNFLLTNRIPRGLATRFMGWFSRIEIGWVRDLSLATWNLFSSDLDLTDAKSTRFKSLHDCFIRELKEGARPITTDPSIMISPCDAIVGAFGELDGVTALQAKGFPYPLIDLLGDPEQVERYRNGRFITLRLRSTMYHRFHAPCAARVEEVVYFAGDTWNVNPIALKRVERLFCKNERAVIRLHLEDEGHAITMVPVAAILVASLKLHFLEEVLDLRYRGPNKIACDKTFAKGEEMGYFQHGSTVILFATGGMAFCENIQEGANVRMGEPLFRAPPRVPGPSS